MFALLASSPFVCLAGGLLLIALSGDDTTQRILGIATTVMSATASAFMAVLLVAMVLA